MSAVPIPPHTSSEGDAFDLFVSYAHADDEVPTGAEQGWVSTLVGELQKVLRRKLGGAGARVWMDHQLAANQNVTEELLRKIGVSRTLLLVMSPGYMKSDWCQRELANYVARATSRGETQSVFPIEIEPVVDRESWPPPLQSLTPIKFWNRRADDIAPTLVGFPKPKPEEDSLYWRNVNELAHLIATRVQTGSAAEALRKTCVLVAETTDDLDDARQSVVSALRQRGDVIVLPPREYPRANESDFVANVRNDLRHAPLFVQLLGPYPGRKPPGGDRSFVAMQAAEALGIAASLRIMQWRPPELDLSKITDDYHRQLLAGEYVSRLIFEEFRHTVLTTVETLVNGGRESPRTRGPESPSTLIKQFAPHAPLASTEQTATSAVVTRQGTPASDPISADGLSLYLQGAAEDRDTANQIANNLARAGASVLAPDPLPGQTFLQTLMAQEDALRLCDGVLFVYAESAASAIAASFQYARRVFGVRRPDVWSAVLDMAAPDSARVPIRSPNLMTIDCRTGFDLSKLGVFFEHLRANGRAAMQEPARHA